MFDLVPVGGRLHFSEHGWQTARHLLLDFQPAKRVVLVGDPPARIRVTAHGDPADVAPGLLSDLAGLAGAALFVELR